MQKKEGPTLKNKMKGTGKELGEIADILGMTRQNLDYHLLKEKLTNDFRRLLNEKNKEIFGEEQFDVTGASAGPIIGEMKEDIISLKGDIETVTSRVLELYAALKGTSYATAETEFLKDAKDATDRLYAESKKKLRQEE